MSVEINTLEEIVVNNEKERTAEFLRELIRHYSSIEYINTCLVQIVVDKEEYVINSATAPDIDAIINNKDGNNEFLRILRSSDKAKRFSLKIGYQGFNEKYGYGYWQDVLTPDLRDFVCCRCLEYYDCDDGIVTYFFDKTHNGEIPWDATPEQIEDVEKWFSYNFTIMIEPDGDAALDEGEIGEYLQSFGEKMVEEYDLCNEPDIYDDLFDFEDSVSIKREQCSAFLNDLQAFADFCKKHDLFPKIICSFTAEQPADIFAAMGIIETDGIFSFEYCRF